MKVKLSKRLVDLCVRHLDWDEFLDQYPQEEFDDLYPLKQHNFNKVTEVRIVDSKVGEFLGLAFCNSADSFKKEFGRKVAGLKCLNQTNYSKEDRKIIWSKLLPKKCKV